VVSGEADHSPFHQNEGEKMVFAESIPFGHSKHVADDRARSVIVLGAGGHAKVTISTLRSAGWSVAAAYDDDPSRIGTEVYGAEVAGPMDAAGALPRGTRAVIAIGSPAVRQQLAERFDFDWVSVVHPHAYVDPTVRIEEGVLVFAGAVVQPDTVLGRHSIINTSASIDHDGRIGEFVNISPGVHLSGNVTIGASAMIGIGTSVLQGLTIGAGTVVGGGAAVICNLPDRVVAVGCPARVIRALDTQAA
jgi:sugar O-acyltransferase (sialic acid O-acetyltransferase NeuD family)